MFFWNSLAFSVIQGMLAIWSLVPLPFQNLVWTFGSSQLTYCWGLAWRILSITLLALFFTASDFTFITINIHNWALFLFWLHLFILSGVISPLFSSSILSTYWPGEFTFQCHIFLSFHIFMGFSRQEYLSGLPFPSPVDHILSELSTMTHLSWAALHSMAYSFIETDKAVVHVISLITFLWLWFSFCLPSKRKG